MEATYRLANGLGRTLLRAWGVRVRAEGLEHLPRSGPVLLACNHVSFLDFVLIEKAMIRRGRYVRFLTRHDVWRPGIRWAMDAMRHVPVDRDVPAAAYLGARLLLRSGEAVAVFPEAGISYSFTVRALMRGAAALARDTGVPVVPVVTWGGQRLFSVGVDDPGPDLTRHRLVDVRLLAPEYVAPDADLTAWTRHLGEVFTRALEDLQQRPEHRPRPGEYAPWHPAHLGGHAPTRGEAAGHDLFPSSAVIPTWGPDLPPAPGAARGPG